MRLMTYRLISIGRPVVRVPPRESTDAAAEEKNKTKEQRQSVTPVMESNGHSTSFTIQ